MLHSFTKIYFLSKGHIDKRSILKYHSPVNTEKQNNMDPSQSKRKKNHYVFWCNIVSALEKENKFGNDPGEIWAKTLGDSYST